MRYIVTKETGMCLGPGMFQVWDTWFGSKCGKLHYLEDDAQKQANRMNLQDREERAESHAIASSFDI